MKQSLRLGVIASTLAALSVVALSAQTTSLPIGKKGEIELREPTTAGSTLLQPGHYRLRHAVQDGQHYLVVLRQETRTATGVGHYGAGEGTEVARVPCEVVALDKKTKATELYTRGEPNGSRVITEIRIQGEGVGHVVALAPKA